MRRRLRGLGDCLEQGCARAEGWRSPWPHAEFLGALWQDESFDGNRKRELEEPERRTLRTDRTVPIGIRYSEMQPRPG